jgi:hypothetical protein
VDRGCVPREQPREHQVGDPVETVLDIRAGRVIPGKVAAVADTSIQGDDLDPVCALARGVAPNGFE